jgi:hypothetical protein
MTSEEALRALGEMITSKPTKENDHYLETAGKILDKEVPFPKTDKALDKLWQKK